MLHPILRDDSKNNCVAGGRRERRQREVESDTLPTTFDQLYNVMGWNRLELKNHKAIFRVSNKIILRPQNLANNLIYEVVLLQILHLNYSPRLPDFDIYTSFKY